jgi:REP element-mobilizing transposase RayT
MPRLEPLYTAANCRLAYQLNWSLSVFGRAALPPARQWLDELKAAVEPDGVRLLEHRLVQPHVLQFFLSSRPEVSPAEVVRSIKGRLQYLIRSQLPRAFRRNYRIESVGSANLEATDGYVAKQRDRHPMADSRARELLGRLQYFDPSVRLDEIQYSSAGQFICNLHAVLENAEGWHEIREGVLAAMRDMIIRASAAKSYRLSRIGLVSNHLHMTLGCNMTDSPLAVGLGLLNNLAFVHNMKAVFKYSFYVGTVGNYDRQAVRRKLPGRSESVT